MNPLEPNSDRGALRNAIHHFVSGFCGVVLGITPPPENKEIRFVAAIVGALAAMAIALIGATWLLFDAIAQH